MAHCMGMEKREEKRGVKKDGDIERGRYTKIGNKIGLFINRMSAVVLSFPFKDCILEGGMTKEEKNGGREERFFHEVIDKSEIDTLQDQKVLTNFSVINIKGEKKVKSEKDVEFFDEEGNLKNNLLIKGNNLLSLYSLRKKFGGKVKMIYIDPPYNTGGDTNIFTYNNSFNHSTWLTFMKNRLEVAQDMLRDDGFIAITIDHAELFYLGVLADEIFGRENRIAIVTILHNPKGRNQAKFFSENSEFLILYARNILNSSFNNVVISEGKKETFTESDHEGNFRYDPYMRARTVWSRENRPKNWYPIYVSKDLKNITHEKRNDYYEIFPVTNNGKDMSWKNVRETFVMLNKGDYFKALRSSKEGNRISIYHKYRENEVLKNVWIDKKYQSEFHGTNLLRQLIGENKFSYPKSLYAVLDTLKITTSDNDIILDFFAGSGTTGHATLALNAEDGGNRKFILCEQIDEHFDICKERLTKVLKQSHTLFSKASEEKVITFELKKYNKIFFDCINAAKTKEELKKCYRDMQKNAFLQFWFDKKKFEENGYQKLSLAEQKNELKKILDLNHMYLNYPDMEDATYDVAQIDKDLTYKFYE